MGLFNKRTCCVNYLKPFSFYNLHLLQCNAVGADYDGAAVYILNGIDSRYALLLQFLYYLRIVDYRPQGVDTPLAVHSALLCHVYGPFYAEAETCIFSDKYFHIYFSIASIIFFTTSSIAILLVSIWMASSAFLNGERALVKSSLFLAFTSSTTSARETSLPFSFNSRYLLLPRISAEASR